LRAPWTPTVIPPASGWPAAGVETLFDTITIRISSSLDHLSALPVRQVGQPALSW
jgi:hypothetical protein